MALKNVKKLKSDDVRELLSLERDDITLNLLRDYFACFMGQDTPRFNTYDKFTLPAGVLYNKETIETTIGKYIFNMFVLPKKFLEKQGYQNIELTKGALGDIEGKLGNMILNNEISTKEYGEYLDNGEWLGMSTAYFLVPTMNYDINIPIPEVIKKRDELFEKYADGVKKGDNNVADLIEKEVLALAKEKLKASDNEAYDFFKSGVGAFENNYKKSSIMAGAIENPYTKKLDILKSNYADGVSQNDFPIMSNLSIIGGYSRGVETQSSGYETKKINNALQTVVLDEPGSDCGTKYFLKVTIRDEIKKLFIDRYVLKGGELVLITDKNISEFVGKEVMMRSPMYCKGNRICNKCAGELFYKLGVENAGLLNSTMSGTLMNLSMKKFHNATVKFSKIDVKSYIKDRNK